MARDVSSDPYGRSWQSRWWIRPRATRLTAWLSFASSSLSQTPLRLLGSTSEHLAIGQENVVIGVQHQVEVDCCGIDDRREWIGGHQFGLCREMHDHFD